MTILRLHDPSKKQATYICTGTVISPTWVLTAAHCVEALGINEKKKFVDPFGRILQVVLGTDELKSVKPDQVRDISDIIIRDGYENPWSTGNDIALLKLTRTWKGDYAPLSVFLQSDPQTPPGAIAMTAGFGNPGSQEGALNKYKSNDGTTYEAGSSRLLQMALPIVSTRACSARYPNDIVGSGQICAGYESAFKDGCSVSGGDPLMAFNIRGCPYLIGIASWGQDCRENQSYGVFTRVSHHADWILQYTKNISSVSLSFVEDTATASSRIELVKQISQKLQKINPSAEGRLRVGLIHGIRRKRKSDVKKIKLGDRFQISAKSSLSGIFILIHVGTKGKVTQIVPSIFSNSGKDGQIQAGETKTIPAKGSAFEYFSATESAGSGNMLALVVPKGSSVANYVTSPRQTSKGLVPEKLPANYLVNILDQLQNLSVNNKRKKEWAFTNLEYQVREVPPHEKPLTAGILNLIKKKEMKVTTPILIRVFKKEESAEVWKRKSDGSYSLLKSYPICALDRVPGPKERDYDRKSPEGFYKIKWLRKKTTLYLAMDLDYPNKFDKLHKRKGGPIQFSGYCASAGNFAFRNEVIEEIYALTREARRGGQGAIPIHAFPFKMTEENLKKWEKSEWKPFWENLKEGFDAFEKQRKPPMISVDRAKKRYIVKPVS